MITTYLSLGSNVEPHRHLRAAVRELSDHFGSLRWSPVYESVAIGFNGPPFLNLVVAFETSSTPTEIHTVLRSLEDNHGRVRGNTQFSSRTLDVDLILYGNLVSLEPPILPRDEILRYAFVLRPLADLAPEILHPLTGLSYAELWRNFDATDQPLWRTELNFHKKCQHI